MKEKITKEKLYEMAWKDEGDFITISNAKKGFAYIFGDEYGEFSGEEYMAVAEKLIEKLVKYHAFEARKSINGEKIIIGREFGVCTFVRLLSRVTGKYVEIMKVSL